MSCYHSHPYVMSLSVICIIHVAATHSITCQADHTIHLLQPELRRAPYQAIPPGMRPPASGRTIWPAQEARDFRDAPSRQGQFYPQHEPSPPPSPRAWQGAPHLMDPTHPAGPVAAPHPGPRYGSPAHFDPMAPGARDSGHLGNPMRFQEEAERRPSPRNLGRPLSRGHSLERGWQPPPLRGSGPGPGAGSYGPAPHSSGPHPVLGTGPPRSVQFMQSCHLHCTSLINKACSMASWSCVCHWMM